jgi:hypothetical protein
MPMSSPYHQSLVVVLAIVFAFSSASVLFSPHPRDVAFIKGDKLRVFLLPEEKSNDASQEETALWVTFQTYAGTHIVDAGFVKRTSNDDHLKWLSSAAKPPLVWAI